MAREALRDDIRKAAHPLQDRPEDFDPLMDLVGNARLVLLGEASHGTEEFYHLRAEITKRLITEKGFHAVAVEADWPDAYRVNRYVKGQGTDADANQALGGFSRFPTWMWRNTEVLAFTDWLRVHNQGKAPSQLTGFYGLDLYSLHTSIRAVLDYLDKQDPEAAARARYRYSCFDHYGEDTQAYGYAASFGLSESCESGVLAQLQDMQRQGILLQGQGDQAAEDEHFFAEQNARLVKNAEAYYRTMFRGHVSSWNLRDQHMFDTLQALIGHIERQQGGEPARIVVWEHNSHLGDARATDMSRRGEFNVGQLVKEHYGDAAVAVGFTTFHGTVTAASNWDAPAERKFVRPGLTGSYEWLFHHVEIPRFLLSLRGGGRLAEQVNETRLERAIGVIYLPESERLSHYFHANLAEQFDAVIHVDKTRALTPLERNVHWDRGEEAPETYPFAI
ncbi:erythromycin esterase family protein [Thermithiobacillus plumbiphilus]|uniref:Erythromycin esterase family protein n=1 Tax=Thermithiobacillus plumbiphilus TaxID=1729899 RepID=A0ABU9D758_9PROT